MSKPRKSLPRRISITIMLLAMPLFVVSLGTFFSNVQQFLHDEAMEHSNSILKTTLQRVVNYMSGIENAANSNAWLLEENFDPDSLLAISRRIMILNPSMLSCSISTEPDVFPQCGRYFSVYSVNEGDTIITVREADFEYFERSWYQAAMQLDKTCWIDPFSDFNEGAINFEDAVASYCVPLRPNGKHIEGILAADFAFSRLAETVLASEHPFPSAYYMLLGSDGRILIHPDSKQLFKKTIFSATDSLQHPDVIALGQAMTAGQQGIMHVQKEEIRYHVCYAPVPNTNWSLALVCPDDEILSDYNHLKHIILTIIIVGLLLIMLITANIVRMNIKPIYQLLTATQRIADGHYDEEIPISNRKDTVSQLQNAFAAMQKSIVTHMEEVRRTSIEVEKENKELEQATQLSIKINEERQRFTRHVLRQIRMPLNIIDGMVDVLRNRTLSQAEAEVVTDTMRLNVARLRRRLLMLYDSSELRPSDESIYRRENLLSCNELAQEAIDFMLSTHQGMEVHLEPEVPNDLCIKTNHLYLIRSMVEILHNSAKYSDGKHITLRVTQTTHTVRFIFEDKGSGLPKEWEQLISQPFSQGNEQSPGLGLGLPLVKRHITYLEGNLIYDPEYHEGCRIIIEMPK